MNEIATSARPFIEQIPKKDRAAVEFLRERGGEVLIRWTNEDWRYDVTLPEKPKP
jgi:hypothetical protein